VLQLATADCLREDTRHSHGSVAKRQHALKTPFCRMNTTKSRPQVALLSPRREERVAHRDAGNARRQCDPGAPAGGSAGLAVPLPGASR
jgi:hypothetical protein